jgi:hypothetical protein
MGFIRLSYCIGVPGSGQSRMPASRPEVVGQAFCGLGTRFFSSEDWRIFNALRYLVSS